MASRLAKLLIELEMIDYVICISPSLIVSHDFRDALESELQHSLDGRVGSIGDSITYQAMGTSNHIWSLLQKNRVFVIFDEIHHCAGSEGFNSNSWGQTILNQIQGKAKFSLALSGTPWRSDTTPISLSKYTKDGQIRCDYIYGINQAIRDKVCRTPLMTLIDNNNITLKNDGETERYNSIEELLSEGDCSYQDLVNNTSLIKYLLKESVSKLNELRRKDSYSGGLIVTSSVSHALRVTSILKSDFNIDAEIVTYRKLNAAKAIRRFKASNKPWIVSVGMISEGTNIPRLRVCCYLSRIRTELYFRQVLGRVLRCTSKDDEIGYFYSPAEPTIVEFSKRVDQDIPDVDLISTKHNVEGINMDDSPNNDSIYTPIIHDESDLNEISLSDFRDANSDHSYLAKSYEITLGLASSFYKQLMTISKSI